MDVLGWIAVGTLVVMSLWAGYSVISNTTYQIDKYFLSEIAKGNKDFKYAELRPYYTKGFYLVYNFGKVTYIIKGADVNHISGAVVQRVVDDVCRELGIPEGSMSHEVIGHDAIRIKIKEKTNV